MTEPTTTSSLDEILHEQIMSYDFNQLERSASKLKDLGRWQDALEVYVFMADGDPSLDGGYLGTRIAECYESLGRLREPNIGMGVP